MKNNIIVDVLITLLVLFNLLTFLTPYTWLIAIPIYAILACIVIAVNRDKPFKRVMLLTPLIPMPFWLVAIIFNF